MSKPIIIITGATGVGKTDFAETLARTIGGEIINCDVGQFYTPLSIGTAKPDWQRSDITQHMFDILDEPLNYSVTAYRARVEQLIKEIHSRGKTPIIVGGSGFYIHGLFFPPREGAASAPAPSPDMTWENLFKLDSKRAQEIHPHDTYRIERALSLWHTTGVLPSEQKPVFHAVSDNAFLVNISRDRHELYERINARTIAMLCESADPDEYAEVDATSGWLGEVARLSPEWQEFLLKKGIIGYPEIINFLGEHEPRIAKLTTSIQKSTRNYAKRQITYWRMLSRKLQEQGLEKRILEANLTLSPIDLYIRQLQEIMQ